MKNNNLKLGIRKKLGILAYILLFSCTFVACGKEEIVSHKVEQDGTAVEGASEYNTEEASVSEPSASNESADTDSYELKEVVVGDVAPEFSTTLVDGSTFTLSENSGKVILLNFWATWCPPCVGEMPAFEKLDADYGDEVVILAVNCMEDEDSVNQFLDDTGYTFPIAYDVEGEVSFTYPSSGIPYTLVIGKDGIVQNVYVGASDADSQYQLYKAAIESALAE